jgi:TPR repeat protein
MKYPRVFAAVAIALYAIARPAIGVEVRPMLVTQQTVTEQDALRAMTDLALKYEHAEGVPKDLQKAHALYCNAAKRGYAEAEFRLGWTYANGRGVQRNDAVAAELFAMAAELGHEHAARLLKYIPKQSNVELPPCLQPDPVINPAPSVAEVAVDNSVAIENRSEIEQLIHRFAPQYAVDPALALAVVSVESAFNPGAVSPKNAQGLMQLIPQTAERFGVRHILNPSENIKGGLAYLRWLLAYFQGDVKLVAAAYNAGERAVERYRGIPPYPETRDYVRKIMTLYRKSNHPFQAEIVRPSAVLARIGHIQR